MISSKGKKRRMLTKILTKLKNSIWLFYLFKKTCKALEYNMKKHVKIEIIQAFNSLTEMTSSVFCMRNQTSKKIFWGNLKSLSKAYKTKLEWLEFKYLKWREK